MFTFYIYWKTTLQWIATFPWLQHFLLSNNGASWAAPLIAGKQWSSLKIEASRCRFQLVVKLSQLCIDALTLFINETNTKGPPVDSHMTNVMML